MNNAAGGEPYSYTGEGYEGYINLLHLRARWYNVGTGTFLSRDVVESEPPYLYVRGNPINRVDPPGRTPIHIPLVLETVGTQYMYSCKCGWIDWHHAWPRISLIQSVHDAVDTAKTNFAWIDTGQLGMQGQVVIYTPDAQGETNKNAIALGIFISQENFFEEVVQGQNWFPGASQSSFSNEDLVSDLIGFHRGVDNFKKGIVENDEASMKEYMRLCDVVGYEYYDKDNIMYNMAEFKRIQESIYFQLHPVPGSDKHNVWGTRPQGQRWKGSVQARGNCEALRCEGSEELPNKLTSITPRPPLDGWAWSEISLTGDYWWQYGQEITVDEMNNRPLNWGP